MATGRVAAEGPRAHLSSSALADVHALGRLREGPFAPRGLRALWTSGYRNGVWVSRRGILGSLWQPPRCESGVKAPLPFTDSSLQERLPPPPGGHVQEAMPDSRSPPPQGRTGEAANRSKAVVASSQSAPRDGR